jgi:hypothetical protein
MAESEPLWGLLFDGKELAAAGPMVMTRFGSEPTEYSMLVRQGGESVTLPGSLRLRFIATEIPSLN